MRNYSLTNFDEEDFFVIVCCFSEYSEHNMRRRIFVGGLSVKTIARQVGKYFERFGAVQEAMIILDKNGVSKLFGYVMFESEASIANVFEHKDSLFLKKKLEIRSCTRPTGRYRKCPPRFFDLWTPESTQGELGNHWTPAGSKRMQKHTTQSPALSTAEHTPEESDSSGHKPRAFPARSPVQAIPFQMPQGRLSLEERIQNIDWEAVTRASHCAYKTAEMQWYMMKKEMDWCHAMSTLPEPSKLPQSADEEQETAEVNPYSDIPFGRNSLEAASFVPCQYMPYYCNYDSVDQFFYANRHVSFYG
jgi:hypothetical protein